MSTRRNIPGKLKLGRDHRHFERCSSLRGTFVKLLVHMCGITSSQKGGSGWCTVVIHVVPVKFDTLSDEVVNVRRLGMLVVVPHVGPTQIISHHKNKVWALVGCSGESRACSCSGTEQKPVHPAQG